MSSLIWFRQDLRIRDNPALYYGTLENNPIIPIYIYDETEVLSIGQAQQWWLHHSLAALQKDFKKCGSTLFLQRGNPEKILIELCRAQSVTAVYWNHCYEPELLKRDERIKQKLCANGIKVYVFNASLLNEPWQIKNNQKSYYKIFTPYWRKCIDVTKVDSLLPIPKFKKTLKIKTDHLNQWNLLPKKPNWAINFSKYWQPGEQHARKRLTNFINNHLSDYYRGRDYFADDITSRLSPYLHFGELGPRQIWLALKANKHAVSESKSFLRQLIWREFSYYLLYHFPKFAEENFQSKFDRFKWENNKKLLSLWQKGQTGYPIIDAAMQELWQTGYMHNRARMLVASLLTKYLLIDWRLGAQWFWNTLLDADLANNSMGWQWVAGTGVDAAPYFRIFNPVLQGKKFDPQGHYVRRWLPVFANLPNRYIHEPWKADKNSLQKAGIILGKDYPYPIVDSTFARERALDYYRHLF